MKLKWLPATDQHFGILPPAGVIPAIFGKFGNSYDNERKKIAR